MKRILAIIMAIVMLLSACAFAEGKEILLKNVQVTSGEYMLLDLSGIELALSYGTEGEATGAKLAVNASGEEVLAVAGTVIENLLGLSMTGLSSSYSVDLEALGALGVSMAANLPVETNEETGKIEFSDEDVAAFEELSAKATEIFAASVTEGEPEDIAGVSCEVTNVSITEEQTAELLGMLIEMLESHPEILDASGLESADELALVEELGISIDGSVMQGEGLVVVDFYLNLRDKTTGEVYSLNAYCDVVDSWDVLVILGVNLAGEELALAFEIDLLDTDTAWLQQDMTGAVNVLTMDEAQLQVLMNEAMTSAMTALAKLAAANETIAGLLYADEAA